MNSLKLMGLSVVAILALSFSGCGSDSDSGTPGTTLPSSIVDLSKCGVNSYSNDGESGTNEYGADGKFEVQCTDNGGQLVLANNSNELIITQVISTTVGKGSDSMDSWSYTEVRNLVDGTAKTSAISNVHGTFNCTQTYDTSSFRSSTINNGYEVFQLIGWWDIEPLTSDCPFDNDDTDDEGTGGSEEIKTTTVVTDSEGTISNILQVSTYTF